jgi:hypothetical protein
LSLYLLTVLSWPFTLIGSVSPTGLFLPKPRRPLLYADLVDRTPTVAASRDFMREEKNEVSDIFISPKNRSASIPRLVPFHIERIDYARGAESWQQACTFEDTPR